MTNSFDIDVTANVSNPEIIIVSFKGEMGYNAINTINQAFEDINKNGKYLFTIADFSQVDSISSAAIGELMGCRTALLENDSDLILVGLPFNILETFIALDANRIFKILKNVQSATNLYHWEYKDQIENVLLSFPPHLTFVPPARQMIRRIAKQKGYSNNDAFRIETIIDEICNNAIEHGHQSEEKEIELKIAITMNKIEIIITNTCDPSKIDSLNKISKYLSKPNPVFDTMRGHGLALVKMLSKDFEIDTSATGTSVHVTKFREE